MAGAEDRAVEPDPEEDGEPAGVVPEDPDDEDPDDEDPDDEDPDEEPDDVAPDDEDELAEDAVAPAVSGAASALPLPARESVR